MKLTKFLFKAIKPSRLEVIGEILSSEKLSRFQSNITTCARQVLDFVTK